MITFFFKDLQIKLKTKSIDYNFKHIINNSFIFLLSKTYARLTHVYILNFLDIYVLIIFKTFLVALACCLKERYNKIGRVLFFMQRNQNIYYIMLSFNDLLCQL